MKTSFVSPKVTAGPNQNELSQLQEAVDLANADEAFTDYGRSAQLKTYPKGTTIKKIVAEAEGSDDVELESLDHAQGKAAVDEFVEVLNNTTGGEEEDAQTQALCDAIASSAKAVFSPTTDFKSVHLYGHGAGDDLGVETRVLIGQKNDGSFVTATFWFNPF